MSAKSTPTGPKAFLCYCECPYKHGYTCISLDVLEWKNGHDHGHGTRLTRGKCCGSWRFVKKFELDESDLVEMKRTINDTLRELKQAKKARKKTGSKDEAK